MPGIMRAMMGVGDRVSITISDQTITDTTGGAGTADANP